MPDRTDFSLLYRELGIEPEAGIEALHRAYRRCLRRLHPDTGDGHATAATVDLSWLVRDYRRALAFHHAHGRLPGTFDPLPSIPGRPLPASKLPLPVAQIEANLAWNASLSRWMQVVVFVIMVVIGAGLLAR